MEEKFEFTFVNGTVIKIVLGEDGYNVNIITYKPLMGTFTSFENLLKGIAVVVQDNVADDAEFTKFAQELSLAISNTLVIDEVEELLNFHKSVILR